MGFLTYNGKKLSKPFTYNGKKVKSITYNGKVLTLQRTISNTWIEGFVSNVFEKAKQHFKEAPTTDILFTRNLVATGDIQNSTRTNFTQQGWSNILGNIMYENWESFYNQQVYHEKELSLHLTEFITEAKKHDIAIVEINLHCSAGNKNNWYLENAGGNGYYWDLPLTINIDTGVIQVKAIDNTIHTITNNAPMTNLGGKNEGNNRTEYGIALKNNVLFMYAWIRYSNQSYIGSMYFTSWRYRKYE